MRTEIVSQRPSMQYKHSAECQAADVLQVVRLECLTIWPESTEMLRTRTNDARQHGCNRIYNRIVAQRTGAPLLVLYTVLAPPPAQGDVRPASTLGR